MERQPSRDEDRNVLNFERLKWGGVRHEHPLYQLLDLQLFEKLAPSVPTDDDVTILRSIFETARKLSPQSWITALQKEIAPLVPGTKQELKVLFEILGYAGVFVYPGYTTHYNAGEPTDNRPYRGGEWNAPAAMWQARDGINSEAVAQYFPAFARDLLPE